MNADIDDEDLEQSAIDDVPLDDSAAEDPDRLAPPAQPGRVRRRVNALRDALTPGVWVRSGFARGAVIFTIIVTIMAGSILRPGLGPVADVFAGPAAALLLALLISGALFLAMKLLGALPRLLTWPTVCAMGVMAVIFIALPFTATLAPLYAALATLGQALLGAAVMLLIRTGYRNLHPFKRWVVVSLAAVGTVMNLILIGWLIIPGSTRHLTEPRADVPIAALEMPNPSHAGPYEVRTMLYGSGTDIRRPEFGPGVEIVTPTVDATPFTDTGKWRTRAREWYWGFDRDAFPLNGRVWHPAGSGPFPLVLIVHGNHLMEDHSDAGYEWIAAHLASRGFIAVSVDQNFLNASWHGNWRTENDCRAWMLLKHLELWRAWNGGAGHPFHGMADMDNIALIGHSRGGEAAAIAAAFNRLEHYPDDARQAFDFNFGIRAVIAIAPSEGQYKPANQGVALHDVNYLVLSGGHDADVAAYLGKRQYNRTSFSEGSEDFKASLYIYRANHGQFNTGWGRKDAPYPLSRILNTRPLLSGEDQRRAGAVVFTAFLEATLRGERGYRPLFQDLRTGAHWLPDDLYLTRFEDGRFQPIARFDEDIDLNSTTAPGGRIESEGLTVWREEHPKYRVASLSRQNAAAVIGWNHESGHAAPHYSIHLPESAALTGADAQAMLSFALAESRERAPRDEDDDAGGHAERAELDFTIELIDAAGISARRAVSDFRAVQPPLIARYTKLWSEKYAAGDGWEPIMQTFLLPLSEFAAQSPGFDPGELRAIRFLFDETPEGVIILDDIGVQEGAQ